jgi:membrane fusion protein (multidrug efflux system)
MNKPLTPDELLVATQAPDAGTRSTRQRLFLSLAGAIALAAIGYGGYETVIGSRHVSTDNAYVDAEVAQITAMTSGPVAQVRVVDTQAVSKGDILVVLDDADRKLELEQARSTLSQIERRVRGYQAQSGALGAQIAAREADLTRARIEYRRTLEEYQRRNPLVGSGAISGEELATAATARDAAQAAVAQAEANLAAAHGTRLTNDVQIDGVSLEQNPEVRAARARVDQALVALDRTIVRAPLDGVVTRRSVQVGQMVQAGAPLMSVVPVLHAFVSANYKEGQLGQVEIGQPVELTSDLYGSDIVFHGRVAGFSGATGASLSIVPAQNATGNWIKTVQRLPVRISLDPQELQAHPLRLGLSMSATIDISR